MKGLFLYGANCTMHVWRDIRSAFRNHSITYVSYPHALTKQARSVQEITRWVYEVYGEESYDFIVGHSMGGLIALQLAAAWHLDVNRVILIEANLKPASMFYRNLLLPCNRAEHEAEVMDMIQRETPFYNPELKKAIQEDFDYTAYVAMLDCPLYMIYGDRGQGTYIRKVDDLYLDKDILEKIHFRFVRNACHMPMLENSEGLIDAIRRCLNEE